MSHSFAYRLRDSGYAFPRRSSAFIAAGELEHTHCHCSPPYLYSYLLASCDTDPAVALRVTLHRKGVNPSVMASMRRLKSSLRLCSKSNDDDLRGPGGTSRRRSNARLQKSKRDAVFFDIPEEPSDPILPLEILPPPKPFRRGHTLRPDATNSSTSVLLGPPSLLGLPYDAVEPDVAPTFTRKDSAQSDASDKRRESISLSKIFGKGKPKRPQPPDNFTKWDSDRSSGHQSLPEQLYDVGASGVDGVLASAILTVGAVAAGPSKPQQKRASLEPNPYSEAMRVRRSWAAAAKVESATETAGDGFTEVLFAQSRQNEKRHAICDIDWSQYENVEELRELISSYDGPADFDPSDISPVDSGVGLEEDRGSFIGKGKGRAIEVADELLDADGEDITRLLASHLESHEECTGQEGERNHRVEALKTRRVEELERELQKEEDRITAARLAREEQLERQRQEEEDHLQAEEFARQEKARIEAELCKPRECVCCGDEKDPSTFPPHPPSYSCEHPSQTCEECMLSWISSEFTAKGCTDLKCPECPETLSYYDVQRAASEETFLAYEKLLTRSLLASIPDFSWCLNPAGCDSGQENSANNNYMECVECKYRQCLQHQCAWHANETCEQYEYRTSGQKSRDEEAATQKILDEVSKKCPGPNCGWRIQKTDGCDHMTCRKCKFEFCWECLASHKEIKNVGNTAHADW